jgi:hypothetical protein
LARFLPAVLVVALLGGSAAAFAVTERLKLERSPILRTRVDKVVSPTSGQPAKIVFRLRKADRVSVAIVDSKGRVVKSLAGSRYLRRGRHELRWYGRDSAGVPLPEGVYRPRLHLAGEHRTILMPNPIAIDTAAPTIARTGLNLRTFSPDGDYRFDYLTVRYRASEPVRAELFAGGRLMIKNKKFARAGKLQWNGRADGLPRAAGLYRLQLRSIDQAGNEGSSTRTFVVRIRYIEIRKHVIRARTGGRIVVPVSTDAHRYTWRIGTRHGRASGHRLVLAAGEPGRYRLVLGERGHRAHALVVVSP